MGITIVCTHTCGSHPRRAQPHVQPQCDSVVIAINSNNRGCCWHGWGQNDVDGAVFCGGGTECDEGGGDDAVAVVVFGGSCCHCPGCSRH